MKVQDACAKLPYISCLSREHEGQSLNLVCVQKACTKSGLLCSLCRETHQGHRILPLKFVITSLRNKFKAPIESDQYCDKLEQLQNLKLSMLYELKCCVEGVAQRFREVEQDIIDTYSKIKIEIFEHVQLSMQMNDLIVSALQGPVNREEYVSNFHKLSKWIKEHEKQITFNMNFADFVVPFQRKSTNLSKQLKTINEFMTNTFKILEKQAQHATSVVKTPHYHLKYRFSSQLKGSSIILNDQKTIATQTSSAPTRFVIIQQGMGLKERTIVFRVKELVNWIGIGVCLKDRITNVNYAFKYEKMGHGSYLLSNNGYTWSHSRPEDNIHACLFTFKKDNTIQVILTTTLITFKVRETNASFSLKIEFKEDEWSNACFCVNLCTQNDSIQILDE